MDKPWKVVFAFIAVFMAGAVFGGLFTLRASGHRLADWRTPERQPAVAPAALATPPAAAPKTAPAAPAAKALITPAVMRELNQRLKLTPAQREKIRPIVGRAAEDLQRLRQQNEQERQRNLADTERVTERMYGDVAALLSASQREELDALRKQKLERVEQERKRRAEAVAAADAALKAERASANQPPESDNKSPALAPSPVPAAKTSGGGK